jgi:hypothetical protein
MKIDNPLSRGHTIYQRRVNRFFATGLLILVLASILIFGWASPQQLLMWTVVGASVGVMAGAVGILLLFCLTAFYDWLLARDSFY